MLYLFGTWTSCLGNRCSIKSNFSFTSRGQTREGEGCSRGDRKGYGGGRREVGGERWLFPVPSSLVTARSIPSRILAAKSSSRRPYSIRPPQKLALPSFPSRLFTRAIAFGFVWGLQSECWTQTSFF